MPSKLWITAAISAALASPVLAQSTRPAPTDSQTAPAGANLDAIRLRSLQAVLDAREKRQDWHDAAQQAEAPIQVDALKQQLVQRLSGLAPRVAKALAAHPQDEALVSVTVTATPVPPVIMVGVMSTAESRGAGTLQGCSLCKGLRLEICESCSSR